MNGWHRGEREHDDAVIMREIASGQRELDALVEERASCITQMTAELSKGATFFSEAVAADLRRHVSRIESRIGVLTDRIAALESKRPTAEQRTAAEAQAREFVAQSETARAAIDDLRPRVMDALNAAYDALRDWVHARASARNSAVVIEDLAARYGLAVGVPSVPGFDARDAQLARLLATFCAQAVDDVPDDVLQRELHAAREARAAVAALG